MASWIKKSREFGGLQALSNIDLSQSKHPQSVVVEWRRQTTFFGRWLLYREEG
jgi:hypothetical protein